MALDYISSKNTSLNVNLGSETGSSVLEVIETARRVTGRDIKAPIGPRRPGDPAKLTASAGRAKELLGWQAQCSDMETLIRTSWDLYK
jgi:UDP-glucose 4-epimerase